MLICELSYKCRSPKDMSDVQRQAMVDNWPGFSRIIKAKRERYTDDEEKVWSDINSWDFGPTQRLTLQEAHNLEIAGIDLSIEAVDGTMLTKMEHRQDKYGPITPMEVTTGQVVQIAIPDIGILMINETHWIEDACTQALQEYLDDGWRILAVCPPNAQRRPDYILGRHDPARKR